MEAQNALIQNSSSTSLHAALKTMMATLYYMLLQHEQLEDIFTPEEKEIISKVNEIYKTAAFLVSKPSGARKKLATKVAILKSISQTHKNPNNYKDASEDSPVEADD